MGSVGNTSGANGDQDGLPIGSDDDLSDPEPVISPLYPASAGKRAIAGSGERPRPSRALRLWRIGGAASALLLASLLLIQTLGPSLWTRLFPLPATPTPYQAAPIRVDANGLSCVHDLSWSPSSQQFALLGQQQGFGCIPKTLSTTPSSNSEIVALYDGHTGQLLRHITLDASISRALDLAQIPQGSSSTPSPSATSTPTAKQNPRVLSPMVFYDSVRWSPNGKELAVLFTVEIPGGGLRSRAGLLLLDAQSGAPERVLQVAINTPEEVPVMVRWDLQGGPPVVFPAVLPSGQPDTDHGPALVYAWDQVNQLRAQVPLPPATASPAPSLGPVGNPNLDQTFTIWQPGQVEVTLAETTAQATARTPVYRWLTHIPAWSPDSQYLFASLELHVRFDFTHATASAAATPSGTNTSGSEPLLPVRDAALRLVLGEIPVTTGDSEYFEHVGLAWRPDGRILATFGPKPVVEVYACANGRKLAVLDPTASGLDPVAYPRESTLLSGLRWSPDGATLLLVQGRLGVFLWRVNQLST